MLSFKDGFNTLLYKLKQSEPYVFNRFSDGELYILRNIAVSLNDKGTFINNQLVHSAYPSTDNKTFIPEEHSFLRDKLIEAFIYKDENYYCGISCPCCIGFKDYKWMKELRNDTSEYTTFANLFLNSNYDRFIKEYLPILKTKKIVLLCNEKAITDNCGLNIVKEFRVGENAQIVNFDIHKDISKWITENNIVDHVFLFAAATLSKITIYELWKQNKQNTYIDIGSTLDNEFQLGCNRDYLRSYWHPELYGRHPDSDKVCILI